MNREIHIQVPPPRTMVVPSLEEACHILAPEIAKKPYPPKEFAGKPLSNQAPCTQLQYALLLVLEQNSPFLEVFERVHNLLAWSGIETVAVGSNCQTAYGTSRDEAQTREEWYVVLQDGSDDRFWYAQQGTFLDTKLTAGKIALDCKFAFVRTIGEKKGSRVISFRKHPGALIDDVRSYLEDPELHFLPPVVPAEMVESDPALSLTKQLVLQYGLLD